MTRVRVTPPGEAVNPYSGQSEPAGWDIPVEYDVQLWPVTAALGDSPSPPRPQFTSNALQLVFPFGTRVHALAKIEILTGPYAGIVAEPDGAWCVDGDPTHWQSPLTGWSPGTVVTIYRTKG